MEAIDLIENVAVDIKVPIDGVFVLDVSELGADKLSAGGGAVEGSYTWVELMCDSSDISIRRGLNMNQNVFARAEATEAQITVHSSVIDPFMNPLVSPNTPIRVRVLVDDEWEPLFVGTIKFLVTKYDKARKPTVEITAYDIIERMNNVQANDVWGREFHSRLSTLADLVGADVTTTGGTVTLAPVMTYRSIWDQMNIAANSEGGFVYCSRQGEIEARGRAATMSYKKIDFSDLHYGFSDHFSEEFYHVSPNHACYTDIEVSYDTRSVINSFTVTNISDDDAGVDIEEALGVYTDVPSIEEFGEANLSALLNLPDTDAVEDLVDYVLGNYAEPMKTVKSITFSPDFMWQTIVDVGDWVGVAFHNAEGTPLVNDDFIVTAVEHSLSASSGWEIKLELFKMGGE